MTKRSLFLPILAIGALSAACSTQPGTMGAPAAGGTMSSSGTAAAPGTAGPLFRSDVQAEGTAAMHQGLYPNGDALATEYRPRGGPVNADAPTMLAPGEKTSGMRWGASDQAD
ncbi:MAG TPA: hypothetical protein VFZ93_07630 [Albitalea sp.]